MQGTEARPEPEIDRSPIEKPLEAEGLDASKILLAPSSWWNMSLDIRLLQDFASDRG